MILPIIIMSPYRFSVPFLLKISKSSNNFIQLSVIYSTCNKIMDVCSFQTGSIIGEANLEEDATDQSYSYGGT